MDGFKAFKYYLAIKLHFTNPKFNVFENRGHIKGSYNKFLIRNDRGLFEQAARQYPKDRDFILFVASNFMYGNSPIYNYAEAQTHYQTFLKRRQSITYTFKNDLSKIMNSNSFKRDSIFKLFLNNDITVETLVILNELDDFIEKVRANYKFATLWFENDLLRVEKASGFVKYDINKVAPIYNQFIEDVQNG